MKVRILSLVLAAAMMATMLVVPSNAQITGVSVTLGSEFCPCDCGQALEQISWKKWDPNTTGNPVSGHYYLDSNYIQNEQVKIISGDRIVLDLRGNDLTTKELGRALLNYGYVAVLDTVGGGRFMSKSSGTGKGGVVMVACNETNDPTFELHSGTIMQDPASKGSSTGGLISIGQNSTFRMTGGILLSGTTYNEAGNVRDGGAISASASSSLIEITGGQIIGCKASGNGGSIHSVGTTILKNCTITGGEAAGSGGNIYQERGKLTIENCTISHGVTGDTKNGGGNVAVFGSAKAVIRDSILENGYSVYHGGNLFVKTATAEIEHTQIYGGVAKARGGNVYTTTACESLTIRDCELPGDLTCVGKKVVLEGNVKIGVLNNGLDITLSTTSKMVYAKGLTEGSEVYVEAQTLFTEPGVNINYFKGAIRTVLSESEEGLVGRQAASGEPGGYCPHCSEQVTWIAYDPATHLAANCLFDSDDDTDPTCTGRHLETGHYYLEGDLAGQATYYAGARKGENRVPKDVVIDLNGNSVTAKNRAFYVQPGVAGSEEKSHLTFLDSYGNGSVSSGGSKDGGGGVLYNEGGVLTVYGGSFVYEPVEGRAVTTGGVLCSSGAFRMYGGILDGRAQVTETSRGGTVYGINSDKVLFEIYAGCILGGSAQSGGGVCFGGNNRVRITGGQFRGGTAYTSEGGGGGGGTIRVYGSSSYKSADVEIKNAAVVGGSVTSGSAGGGNLSLGYGTITIEDSYIAYGSSTAYAGNITMGTNANVTITNSIILGGKAGTNGGNIHVSATNATPTYSNCLILAGSATENGGNINLGHGTVQVRGGMIAFGSAGNCGGNILANAGNYSATSTNNTRLLADGDGNPVLIAGGTAEKYGGNIFVGGVLYLENATISNGSAPSGSDVYLEKASKQGKLSIESTQTDGFQLSTAAELLGTPVYGNTIANTECTQLNAQIILEQLQQHLCVADGKLCIAGATLTDTAGNVTAYPDNASAVAGYQTNNIITLYTDEGLVLTKDCTVDLNGQTVAVSGPYTLNCGDTAGGGKAILAEETCGLRDNSLYGDRYLAMQEGNVFTYHTMNFRISGVSLRPEEAGIYYTAQWDCSDTVANMIESYGVAVSLVSDPTAEFFDNNSILYTSCNDFDQTQSKTSCMITGILDEAGSSETNQRRGEMPIYAKAYIRLTDGSVFISSETVAYSLYTMMSLLDTQINTDPLNYRRYTLTARNFYEKWLGKGTENWKFSRICAQEKDDVIDVLMIGSSFCSYYVQELYGLAKAADVKMRVCNVYYSGCPLEKHYKWWVDGVSNYQYFETFSDAGRVRTAGVSLEWCLAQHDWDVITLQESTSRIFENTAEKHLETTRTYYTELLTYLKQEFPNAMIGWHQPWTYQVGTNTNGYVMESFEQQEANEQEIREYAQAVCEEFDIQRINTGDAWQIVRGEYGYDNLCARLGKGENHEGDYYHDGDIGGGQYLNACVWFEIITGQSSVGVPYEPTWTYNGKIFGLDSDITYAELQEAAHKAVLKLRTEETEQ